MITMEFWNPNIERLPEEELKQLQERKLRRLVENAFEYSSFYKERFRSAGISPNDIRSLEDLAKLPFTLKTDLRGTYPTGMFSVPQSQIVRFHVSSGTTGVPTVVGYTVNDIDVWSTCLARSLTACGLGRGDVVQVAYGYGLFTGGLGLHYGAEGIGATVIPISGGNTDRQIMVMKDFGVTAIVCTPSYFVHLIERAGELGVDVRELPLRVGVFGAEPWSDSMRRHIESRTRIKAYDIYGLSEITGPGVASECSAQHGLHIFEDHFYPEIVNPETGEPLPEGEEGELIL